MKAVKFTNSKSKILEQKKIKSSSNINKIKSVIKQSTFHNIRENKKKELKLLSEKNDLLLNKSNKTERKIEKLTKKLSSTGSPLSRLKKGGIDLGIYASSSLGNLADEDDVGLEITTRLINKSFVALRNNRYKKQRKIFQNKKKFINKKLKINEERAKNKFIKNDVKTNKFYLSEESLNPIKKFKHNLKVKREFKKLNKVTFKQKIKNYFSKKLTSIKNLPKATLKFLGKFLLKFSLIFLVVIAIFIVLQAFILPLIDKSSNAIQQEEMLMILNAQSKTDELPKIETPQDFMKIYAPRFKQIADEYNVYASVMMAQAILESNWGRDLAGTRTNLFGIKCYNESYGCAKPVTTQEDNGKIITIKASFQEAPYGGIDNAILLYLDFMENGALYSDKAVKLTKTYHKNYKSAVESVYSDIHYATDRNYVNKLNEIIEENNLTFYDTPENPNKPIIANVRFKKLKNKGTNIGIPVPLTREELPGYITSEFGRRYDPETETTEEFHYGIDIAMNLDTPIYATHNGKITFAGWDGGYGQVVYIDKGNVQTRYAHLNKISVQEGDIVKAGDQIGNMGTTGRSTGVHLHFEVRINGEAMDPYPFLMNKKKY